MRHLCQRRGCTPPRYKIKNKKGLASVFNGACSFFIEKLIVDDVR